MEVALTDRRPAPMPNTAARAFAPWTIHHRAGQPANSSPAHAAVVRVAWRAGSGNVTVRFVANNVRSAVTHAGEFFHGDTVTLTLPAQHWKLGFGFANDRFKKVNWKGSHASVLGVSFGKAAMLHPMPNPHTP
jgi:hypothetical protein